ncbi:MAG: type II toxin-antitoxin system Phd/YefM family antitoxin [bacterium]
MKLIKDSNNTISAFDAKTNLFRLLKEVEEGQIFTITRRGKPVARLIPFPEERGKMERDEILKEFDSIREKIEGEVDIKSYIQEGRRH